MYYLFAYILITLLWQCSVCLRLKRSLFYKAAGRRMLVVSAVAIICLAAYLTVPILGLEKATVGIIQFWVVMIGAFCIVWAALITANIYSQALHGDDWMTYRNVNIAAALILPWGVIEFERNMKDAKAGCLTIAERVEQMFHSQTDKWPLARQNFEALHKVLFREVKMDGFSVYVQCNPARKISTTAKIDKESINARPCFLCHSNRPKEQMLIPWRNYDILVNPYPIFDPHLTIPCRNHERQQIEGHIQDMLALARELPGWAVFYNGPKCGASAPDHFHFQAVHCDRIPLIADYNSMPHIAKLGAFTLKHYLREVLCIEGPDSSAVESAFNEILPRLHRENDEDWEPMMNLVCQFTADGWRLFVLPRALYRPWQYTAEGEDNLMISPGTIEMCGVMIAPREDDYNRLSADDIKDIFSQVSYTL